MHSYTHIDLKKGRASFEKIPDLEKAEWAWNILSELIPHIETVPIPVLELKDIAMNSDKWKDAHGQFVKIRQFSLENKDFEPEVFMYLAEKVAKIIYNVSNEPAPFDHDSGWYIRDQAIITARLLKIPNLEESIIKAIEF